MAHTTAEPKITEPPKKTIVSKGLSSISSTRIILNKPIIPPVQEILQVVEETAPDFSKDVASPVEQDNQPLNTVQKIEEEPFSLTEFWSAYANDAYQSGKKSSSSAMKVVTPVHNGNIILIEVKNEQQREAIEAIRIDFLSIVRKKGLPSDIQFEFFVNPDKHENLRPYTDKEKIEYLASKNIWLQKLINELNLKV